MLSKVYLKSNLYRLSILRSYLNGQYMIRSGANTIKSRLIIIVTLSQKLGPSMTSSSASNIHTRIIFRPKKTCLVIMARRKNAKMIGGCTLLSSAQYM